MTRPSLALPLCVFFLGALGACQSDDNDGNPVYLTSFPDGSAANVDSSAKAEIADAGAVDASDGALASSDGAPASIANDP